MKGDLICAVAQLQAHVLHCEKKRDYWRVEQAEEALNILLAVPDRADEACFLVRTALADSSKKLRRREKLFATYGPAFHDGLKEDDGGLDALLIETSDLLSRQLAERDQKLLKLVLLGSDAQECADACCVPLARIRERVCRARTRARAARLAA